MRAQRKRRRSPCARGAFAVVIVAAYLEFSCAFLFVGSHPCRPCHRIASIASRQSYFPRLLVLKANDVYNSLQADQLVPLKTNGIQAAASGVIESHAALSPNGTSPIMPTEATTPPCLSFAEKLKLGIISSTSILLLLKLYQLSGNGIWRYYLAGGLCAAISHTVPVPIDVIKTRKQVDPSLEDASFSEVTKRIIQQDGLIALLDGLGPTTVGYMLEGGIKFGVYEVLKPIVLAFLEAHSRLNNQWMAYLMCGFAAGLAASMVLCPMEAIRIRIVSERKYASKGWVDATSRLVKTEGPGFLTKGLSAMIFKQVPYTMTKNVSFDFFAMHLYALLLRLGAELTLTVKFCVPFLAALTASILSCVSSQPGDILLSLVNAHGGDKGTKDVFRDLVSSQRGVRGFFVGMKARFLHVGVIVTLQLLVYDLIKRLCGIAATGL